MNRRGSSNSCGSIPPIWPFEDEEEDGEDVEKDKADVEEGELRQGKPKGHRFKGHKNDSVNMDCSLSEWSSSCSDSEGDLKTNNNKEVERRKGPFLAAPSRQRFAERIVPLRQNSRKVNAINDNSMRYPLFVSKRLPMCVPDGLLAGKIERRKGKERSKYLFQTGDPLDSKDPRTSYQSNFPPLKPVLFTIDQAWRGDLPPRQVLLRLDASTDALATKAQLLGWIERRVSGDCARGITEASMHQHRANDQWWSIEFAKAHESLELVRWAMAQEVATGSSSRAVTCQFDPGGAKFERLKKTVIPAEISLSCNPKIPCIGIDYEPGKCDQSWPSSRVADAFRHRGAHPVSVERGKTRWHVHFTDLADVAWVYERRGEFTTADGRRLRPYPIEMTGQLRRLLDQRTANHHQQHEWREMRDDPRHDYYHRPKIVEAEATSSISRPTMDALGSLYLRANRAKDSVSVKSRSVDQQMVDDDLPPPPAVVEKRSLDDHGIKGEGKRIKKEKAIKLPVMDDGIAAQVVIEEVVNNEPISQAEEEKINEPILHSQREPILHSQTGSARTDGYWKQTEKSRTIWTQKEATLLPSWFLGINSKAVMPSNAEMGEEKTNSSRSSRLLNRKSLAALLQTKGAIPNPTSLTSSFSAFQSRKKQLLLMRSSIHSWGLFAGHEPIDPGDMVIEYVGELVRLSVANLRERRLEERAANDSASASIACSYLFRLDEHWVIDATYKGNLARFINHSCDPNCVARILQVDGERRILMYARRAIGAGEEITYDYKFPRERDPTRRVRCLCGQSCCRGYLN